MRLALGFSMIVLLGLLGLSSRLDAEEAQGMGMTHEELAQAIVMSLGLRPDLPVTATVDDYISYLQGRGIVPLRGWIPGVEVIKDDLAVVTVQALGLADEVKQLDSPESYVAVLDERGIGARVTVVTDNMSDLSITVWAAIVELGLDVPASGERRQGLQKGYRRVRAYRASGAVSQRQSGETATGASIYEPVVVLDGQICVEYKTRTTAEGNIIKFTDCPRCKTNLQLPSETTAGNKVKCGVCGLEFILQQGKNREE